MTGFVATAGIVGQMVAWTVVRRERWPFWPATVVTFAVLGVASVLVGDIVCCADVDASLAIGVGLASCVLLYAATRAVLARLAGVAVIAVWLSLPLLAGAIVGGALWTGLAVWSGGVLAPFASHLVWTGLMLLWPPRRRP
jgi:hypothetical protein